MHERRKLKRTEIYKAAKILWFGRREPLDCLVRNITNLGALLEVTTTGPLPCEFALSLDGSTSRRCG